MSFWLNITELQLYFIFSHLGEVTKLPRATEPEVENALTGQPS